MSPGGQIFGLRVACLLPAFTLPFLQRNFRIGRFRMGICHPIPQRNCGRFTRPSLDPPGERTASSLGVQGSVVNRGIGVAGRGLRVTGVEENRNSESGKNQELGKLKRV